MRTDKKNLSRFIPKCGQDMLSSQFGVFGKSRNDTSNKNSFVSPSPDTCNKAIIINALVCVSLAY